MKLTVYFDSSFWYGLVEYIDSSGDYRAVNYLFGKEPKDSEVMDFVNTKLDTLVKRDATLTNGNFQKATVNQKKLSPKRMQRLINKEKRKPIVSTKAQLAITMAREASKTQKKTISKDKKEKLKTERFLQKQEKKRQKKKGH